ncbi:MAG: RimK family alpha-L-glutamate ligase [Proteobacteria bacterium]|nr:RimK family alpha-L-glutamate ligase [Pseudomonadota bacterium]MBU1710299.1 RimK family alpha-L-glutamate ligase [Pseudomonadota bacterium]
MGGEVSFVALGSRMRAIPEVQTLGVKPNYHDYTPRERQMINQAKLILYPSLNYAQFFTTAGRKIFPSVETYLYADEKIKQTTLFNLLEIPHPRTRFYYSRKKADILDDFTFPFIAKIPRASSMGKGVFKITNLPELEQYLRVVKVGYIQEYLPHSRDLRVVLINYRCVLAYWRKCAPGNFRANISQGGEIDFDNVPEEAIGLAEKYARRCKFNDVGLDLLLHDDSWYIIEANMQYGREGFRKKKMVLKEVIREKLLSGELFSSP